MTTETKYYHMNDVDELKENNKFILDVREPFEFEDGHIMGAKNIPLNQLEERLNELPNDEEIYVYCQSSRRSKIAVNTLENHGYHALDLDKGYSEYEGKYNTEDSNEISSTRKYLELSGLQCPGPLLRVNGEMEHMNTGEQLEVLVTDPGFYEDVKAWAKKTGNKIVKNEVEDHSVSVILEKSVPFKQDASPLVETKDGATMVVFSGDLDKALASFIIAIGAKSMGKDVTMFFTFWGLNIIKDPHAPKVSKTGVDKLFSAMMPKSASKLPISKMNMFGMGSKMIQYVMNKKRVDALSEMIQTANTLGIKMVACTMSMDVMAVDASELFPFIEYGGVGTYLGDTESSNLNLFI